MIPHPRKPTCLRHHVWMAACQDCAEAHRSTPPPGAVAPQPSGQAPEEQPTPR